MSFLRDSSVTDFCSCTKSRRFRRNRHTVRPVHKLRVRIPTGHDVPRGHAILMYCIYTGFCSCKTCIHHIHVNNCGSRLWLSASLYLGRCSVIAPALLYYLHPCRHPDTALGLRSRLDSRLLLPAQLYLPHPWGRTDYIL